MKKWKTGWLLVCCLFWAGCGKEAEEETGFRMYYVNNEEQTIESVSYSPEEKNIVLMVEEMIRRLFGQEEGDSMFPEDVIIRDYEMKGDILRLEFSPLYRKIAPVDEILCRAAIVKNFIQIPGISYVEFTINGRPMTDSRGNPIRIMSSDSFMESSGKDITAYQYTEMELYFANETGDKLVRERRSVYHTGNAPIEKVVVEQLIRGPKEENHLATISPNTRIIAVSVADKVAYVNLNQRFASEMAAIEEELPIYSIVNSLVATGNVTKVQISVNGETKITFGESMQLDQLYEKKPELVEEKEET